MLRSLINRTRLRNRQPITTSVDSKRVYSATTPRSDSYTKESTADPQLEGVARNMTFFEKPLGLSGSDGYGWPRFVAGDLIGPGGRYCLTRKLGWVMSSSVWLARDQQ
jgi:hypothetical protein